MPRGVRKEKKAEAVPSPAPTEKKDEIIQLDDGTSYRTVAGRKVKFNNDYPNGCIEVELVTNPENKDYFVVKATVKPDVALARKFTAYGQCERVAGDKFASLEKAETTAIGRALSHMSNHILGASASEDEIAKATGRTNLQSGIRDVIPEEEKKPNPKAEPDVSKLSETDKEVATKWMFDIANAATKEALVEMGAKIKEANLSKTVNEELRKAFNQQLRALSARKEENALAR